MTPSADQVSGAALRSRHHAHIEPAWRVARLIKGAVVRAEETERLVRQRCEEARRSLEMDRQDAERVAAMAHEDAVVTGLARGAEELATAITALESQRCEFVASVPRETVDAAIALAEAILRERIDESPSRWIAVLEPVIARLRGRRTVVLVTDPRTAVQIGRLRDQLELLLPGVETLEIVPDPRASVGSIRVDTEVGSFAASVRSRLEAMCAAVLVSEEQR